MSLSPARLDSLLKCTRSIPQSTAIVKKLNRIQDFMLRKHDTELWLHMRNLGIAPQVYGL